MINKLIKISNQLLDLGKRNRLLNYKDTGFKTLNILNNNIEQIFRGITNGKEFNIFNLDSFLSNYRKKLGVTLETENTQAYSNDKILEICVKNLEQNDILCFKQNQTLDKVLKSLIKEYRFSLTEKGINALYLSFGFINYKEDNIDFYAPLLLIPVELNNDTGSYTLSEYEDEVLLNPTLAYYFDVMYNVKLPEYKNEALATYFTKIKEILPKSTDLEQRCSIGIYSFYKMNMYNDLIQNKEIVVQNKNIGYILDSEVHIDKKSDNEPIYPVVNFDSSQLEAIQYAANGISFCLQGPPGSGKSQTITNIIASLLGSGKKILFVSEKIAALRVVYENLRRSGLNDFALELHSNKTNKKEFIESIYNAAILPKYNMDFKTRQIVAKYDGLISNLSKYEYELHKIHSTLGISLLDLYSLYLNIDIEPKYYDINIDNLNLFDLDIIYNILEQYSLNHTKIGYDYRDCFFAGLDISDEEYFLSKFDYDLDISLSHLTKLKELGDLMKEDLRIDIKTIADIYSNMDTINRINHIKYFKPVYFKSGVRGKLEYMVIDYLKTLESLDKRVLDLYSKEILNEDLETLVFNYKKSSEGLKIFNKELKNCNNIIFKYRSDNKNKDNILNELNSLLSIKNSLALVEKYKITISKYLGETDVNILKDILKDLKIMSLCKDISIDIESYHNFKNKMKNLNIDFKKINEEKGTFEKLSRYFNTPEYRFSSLPYDLVYSKINTAYKNKAFIFTYINTMKNIETLKLKGTLDYLNWYLDNNLPLDLIGKSYKKLFYKKNIKLIIKESEILNKFSSQTEEDIVENFIELDEKILKVNRDSIISNNSQKRPDKNVIIEGSEFKLLSKEQSKTRKQMPIRQLLDQIFNLTLDVKPVFLMSPLSVSTYLTSQLNMFDCVIFDEASQIFASDALGSIYRGKQCIIIGDTKQMPPTSFFQAEFGFDEDEAEFDMESILDKATSCFKTLSLKWHYRSRSEELINFSNKRFYGSNLITIPQAKNHSSGFGIDFMYVENGLYDSQTRTNVTEAQYVCDLVFEHIVKSDESIGVVAFSNVQAELINELVERKLKKNPEYQTYFNKYIDEPFFVKNLESVQGDERDRIIFSICYGYNSDNKFHQRFGPLNTKGGERRLNVAITRAKFNITVVSSIHYNDINIKTTNSLGVVLLRDYLEFSERVVLAKNYMNTDNGIINTVIKYVKSLGYEAYPNYGSSSFKVDIAVKKDDDFFFAIMIDGKDYSTSLTDKYRLEKLLLERLGWNYFKLYSTAWLNDNSNEKERLKEALLDTKDKQYVLKEKDYKTFLKVDKQDDSIEAYFKKYQELLPDLANKYLKSYDMQYLIKEILRKESPVHKEQLYKRIMDIMEEKKLTQTLKDEIDSSIPVEATLKDDFYLYDQYMDIKLRYKSKLPPSYIHINEYMDGLYTIVGKNNGISVDDCYRTVAQIIGYEKLTPNIKKCLEGAYEELRVKGKVKNIEGYFYIAK